MRSYLILLLLATAKALVAQSLPAETSTRKAWQPNQLVLATDFNAPPSEQLRRLQQQA